MPYRDMPRTLVADRLSALAIWKDYLRDLISIMRRGSMASYNGVTNWSKELDQNTRGILSGSPGPDKASPFVAAS